MSELLSELGKKLADRWLTALLLPGLLITAAAVCAGLLGQHDALDFIRLATEVQRFGVDLQPQPAAVILAAVAVLLSATAAGLAAQALGAGVHKALVGRRPRWWVHQRHKHAVRAAAAANHTPPAAYLPARLTPAGDRFRLVGERVDAQYGLAVTLAWPRLWLLLPDPARSPIVTGYTSYRSATGLTGWGLLYLALGGLWWPAAVAGVLTVFVGYRRAMTTAATVADLIEAAVDTYQQALATAVGIPLPHGRLTPEEGAQINNILNKRA
jgi:hypothetical protein